MLEERERTSRQTRGDGERSRCEIRRLFPPGFNRSSLSLFLFISLRSHYYAPARIYVRAARGVTYPPVKTTQRHRQSAFRRAIGPRRHSETQWKAQIRHRLPVRGNEFGKLLANRAGSLAFRWYPPALVAGFDPYPYTASTCPQSHPNAGNSRRLVVITAESRLVISRCAFPPFAKNGADLDRFPP